MPRTESNIIVNLPESLSPVNQRRLFIHDAMVMGDPGISALSGSAKYYFPERALWLADPDDLVMLARPVEEVYLDYLRSLNVGPRYIHCVHALTEDGLIETVLTRPQWADQLTDWAESRTTPVRVDTLCITQQTHRLTNRLSEMIPNILPSNGDPAATFLANHKSYVYTMLEDLGIPRIPGRIVKAAGKNIQETIDRIRQAVAVLSTNNRQVIVRADYWSGGDGNIVVDAKSSDLEAWLVQRREIQTFLVQAYLPWRASPNVQFWLSPCGRVEPGHITHQRVSERTMHFGNEYPVSSQSNPELHRQSTAIAAWLASIGVRGFVGLDFIDTYANGMRFVEVNARANGSTYASAIVLRVNQVRTSIGCRTIPAWSMRKRLPVRISSFRGLVERASDLIYDHSKRAGIIPYWTGELQSGFCNYVTVAEDAGQLRELEAAFTNAVGTP